MAPGYIPERAAYRTIQDGGRAISEVRFPTLRKAVAGVLDAVVAGLPRTEEAA